MKKKVESEINMCDFCSYTGLLFQCRGCKKDVCLKCSVRYPVTDYPPAYRDNPCYNDAYYCKECDAKLVDDPQHKLWVELRDFFDKKRTQTVALHQEEQSIMGKLNRCRWVI